jgi:hypothetical protein
LVKLSKVPTKPSSISMMSKLGPWSTSITTGVDFSCLACQFVSFYAWPCRCWSYLPCFLQATSYWISVSFWSKHCSLYPEPFP